MTTHRSARRFFFLLLAGATVLMALVVRPLATPLFLAVVLAVVLSPLQRKLTGKFGKRPNVASGVLVLGVVLLLVAPLATFSAFIVKEGSDGFQFVSTFLQSDGVAKLVGKLPTPVEKLANEILATLPELQESGDASKHPAADKKTAPDGKPDSKRTAESGAKPDSSKKAGSDAKPDSSKQSGSDAKPGASEKSDEDPLAESDGRVSDQIAAAGGQAVAAVGAAAKATGSLLFQTTMMLIALFFLLVQGEALVAWLDGVLPLRRGQTSELLDEFKTVSYAVVVSTVATSAIQALAALVGYLIAQVPHPLFFCGLTFFVAFIPAIGAASVCLLAALVLLATEHPYMALFLAIWAMTVVALVDNFAKPLLMKSGMRMSGAVVFFALIGGLGAFGAAGLLIGPLVVALFLALLRIYQRDFADAARS